MTQRPRTRWLARIGGLIAAIYIAGSLATPGLADTPVRIKLATLAPRGSVYHRVLQQLGEAFRQAEGAQATFTIYTDGSQGSEADVVRRMRIGQVNAAMMTAVGLSEIDRSASALQKMPLVFHSTEELDYAGRSLRPELERKLLDKGFVTILWAEAGWVRFFCKEPAALPADLKDRRMFSWAGDEAQVELMKRLGYRPVVLETADIIPGLQTGLIDTVAVTPMWALATQVDQLAPNMIDIKWAPIAGALVITKPAWEQMSPAGQQAIRNAARQAVVELQAYQERADTEAIAAMQKRGLKVRHLEPPEEKAWEEFAQRIYPLMRGEIVPAATFDEALRLVAEYRRR